MMPAMDCKLGWEKQTTLQLPLAFSVAAHPSLSEEPSRHHPLNNMFLYDFLKSNMTTSDLANSFPHHDTVLSRSISPKGLLSRVYSCLMLGVQRRIACCVANVTTATLKLNHSTFNSTGIMLGRFL